MNKPNRWLIMSIAVIIGVIIIAVALEAATLEVGPSGGGYPYNSIQLAINDAIDGDVVLVHNGTYVENINFSGKAITVKSVSGAVSTIIDSNADDAVVKFLNNEAASSVLDGFTITNVLFSRYGSGISCSNESSPTITNCIISNNTGFSYAGGISCQDGSSPAITNCTISGNTSSFSGGGGISCGNQCKPTITNCTISNNTSSKTGGGIYCYVASPVITNCTISGNTASYIGGGFYCDNGSKPVLTNCTISGNASSGGGGGIASNLSSPRIINCTISGNTGGSSGGGFYSRNPGGSTIINSILWGNISEGVPNEIGLAEVNILDITYSNIQGGYEGINNIDCNPLFMGVSDYHLTGSSPCINSGYNNATTLSLKDKDGQPRIVDGIVDMGAYEYTEETTDYDGTGTWNYSLTNNWTAGNAGCNWLGIPLSGKAMITQNRNSLTVVTDDGITYTGTVCGSKSTSSASYPDKGGTMTVTINITPTSSTSGSGTLTSYWTSGPYYCDGGADISFTKICSYSISLMSKSFPPEGGTDSVGVSATGGDCSLAADWTATSNALWITITSGSSGIGDGTVNYFVLENTSTSSRTGTITIAGEIFTVTQVGTNPFPDIKANVSDVPVTLGTSDFLLVNVSLNAWGSSGMDCDWWVAADVSGTSTIDGWYYFDVGTMNWTYAGGFYTDLSPTYQGPLFNLSTFDVLNISGLPVGTYAFYFAVDTNMNGTLDIDELFFDFVFVYIVYIIP